MKNHPSVLARIYRPKGTSNNSLPRPHLALAVPLRIYATPLNSCFACCAIRRTLAARVLLSIMHASRIPNHIKVELLVKKQD